MACDPPPTPAPSPPPPASSAAAASAVPTPPAPAPSPPPRLFTGELRHPTSAGDRGLSTLIAAGDLLLSRSADLICLWDLRTGELAHQLGPADPQRATGVPLGLDADGRRLVTDGDCVLVIDRAGAVQQRAELPLWSGGSISAWSGREVALQSQEALVAIGLDGAQRTIVPAGLSFAIRSAAYGPGGRLLAFVGGVGRLEGEGIQDPVTLIDAGSGQQRWRVGVQRVGGEPGPLAFSGDGRWIAYARHPVVLLSAEDGQAQPAPTLMAGGQVLTAYTVAFVDDARLVVAGDGASIYDVAQRRSVDLLPGDGNLDPVTSCAILPGGGVALGRGSGRIHVWSAPEVPRWTEQGSKARREYPPPR